MKMCFAPGGASLGHSAMPSIRAKQIEYGADEEHILRRLGGALVVQWDALSPDLRDRLIEQALFMGDRDWTAHQLREQIEAFISRHKAPG
jgi:hypothetical protein